MTTINESNVWLRFLHVIWRITYFHKFEDLNILREYCPLNGRGSKRVANLDQRCVFVFLPSTLNNCQIVVNLIDVYLRVQTVNPDSRIGRDENKLKY